MELTDFLGQVESMTVDELYHHGVKGMHWGIRKDRSSGTGESTAPDHTKRNKALKIAGGVAVAAVVVAGSVYLAKHPELLQKAVNSLSNKKTTSQGKKFVDDFSKSKNELTGVAHLTGAGNLADRAHRKGGLSDVYGELTKHDLVDYSGNLNIPPNSFKRYGENLEKIAVSFPDPHGRNDFAGRPILHQVLLPKQHAEGISDFESAKSKAWSLVKDSYNKFSDYANRPDANNAEARRLGLMD